MQGHLVDLSKNPNNLGDIIICSVGGLPAIRRTAAWGWSTLTRVVEETGEMLKVQIVVV